MNTADPVTDTDLRRLDELIEIARDFGGRGWTPATSGNYSVRLDDGTIAITRSGADKRRLQRTDLMRLAASGAALDDAVPSAEAPLHIQIYAHDPETRAVLHVHSPSATVVSRGASPADSIVLENYELLKALEGVASHADSVALAIVPNDQNMQRLAATVAPWLARPEAPPAYLIAGHGIYAWGHSIAAAARHLEALDFVLNCELLEKR